MMAAPESTPEGPDTYTVVVVRWERGEVCMCRCVCMCVCMCVCVFSLLA